MKRKYRSTIAGHIHEDIESLYLIDAITKKEVYEWDERCVTKAFRESVRAEREEQLLNRQETQYKTEQLLQGNRSAVKEWPSNKDTAGASVAM